MLHTLTLKKIQEMLSEKSISSVELNQYFMTRIHALDPQINSFISIHPEKTLHDALRADNIRAQQTASPHALLGIPISHKDIFCTQNHPTTCASRMLHQFSPPYSAHIVECLASAGAITLGKNNMDEFAMGSTTETSYFGPCKNPWHTDYSPGGSSGGSAAAVAAGLTPLATGTDTGGSIRQPAALCGICGLKPTYGRVSRWGMIAFASSLDQAGPMARTAEDCAIALNTMSLYDNKDSTCSQEKREDYTARLNQPILGTRIGVPRQYLEQHCDIEIQQAIQDCLVHLEKQGAIIKDIELIDLDLAISAYYIIASAECSSNLARYDGVRYGHRSNQASTLEELYANTRTEGFGTEVKRRILLGTYVLSSGFYDAYYLKAARARRLIKNTFEQQFESVDSIFMPVTAQASMALNQFKDDPTTAYSSDLFTLPANLAGLPALSFPIGQSKQNMPIGGQLMGPYFSESLLLSIAHHYQQHSDWHQKISPIAAKEVSL